MAKHNYLGNLAFNGKSLLITGGDTGIGAATAKLAAQRGARIFIASLNKETLQKTADEINASGGECQWIVCDVRHQDQVEKAVQAAVDAYGSLDLAYSNAGVAHAPTYTHEFDENIWHKVVDINVTGTFYFCKSVMQQFMKQGKGGNLVINGSMAGVTGVGHMIAYVSSKHALAGMTKSLAVEYGQHGIRVNFQGPGATETNMLDQAIEDVTTFRKAYSNDKMPSKMMGPLNRNQTPEEQAEVACFLLSDASSGMTGAIVLVDCGTTAY
jgi:NAD(P)-dependent dehydrogenase (short-subunit alcohol dehydrogenase family)